MNKVHTSSKPTLGLLDDRTDGDRLRRRILRAGTVGLNIAAILFFLFGGGALILFLLFGFTWWVQPQDVGMSAAQFEQVRTSMQVFGPVLAVMVAFFLAAFVSVLALSLVPLRSKLPLVELVPMAALQAIYLDVPLILLPICAFQGLFLAIWLGGLWYGRRAEQLAPQAAQAPPPASPALT